MESNKRKIPEASPPAYPGRSDEQNYEELTQTARDTNHQARESVATNMAKAKSMLDSPVVSPLEHVVKWPWSEGSAVKSYVFVAGMPGMGKSSLINETVGANILPSGGGTSSLTMVPVQIEYADQDDFRVEIQWITEQQWCQRFADSLRRINDTAEFGDAEDDPPDYNRGKLRWAHKKGFDFLKSQFPVFNWSTRESLKSDQLFPELWLPELDNEISYLKAVMDKLNELQQGVPPEVLALLKRGRCVVDLHDEQTVAFLLEFLTADQTQNDKWLRPFLEFHRLLLDKNFTSTSIGFKKRRDVLLSMCIPALNFMHVSANSLNYWPLIQYVTVRGRFPHLPKGVTLIDTPGTTTRSVNAKTNEDSEDLNDRMRVWEASTGLTPPDAHTFLWYVMASSRCEHIDLGHDIPAIYKHFSPEEVSVVVSQLDLAGDRVDTFSSADKLRDNIHEALRRTVPSPKFIFCSVLAHQGIRGYMLEENYKITRTVEPFFSTYVDDPLPCGIPQLRHMLRELESQTLSQERSLLCNHISALMGWLNVAQHYNKSGIRVKDEADKVEQLITGSLADIRKEFCAKVHRVVSDAIEKSLSQIDPESLKLRIREEVESCRTRDNLLTVAEKHGQYTAIRQRQHRVYDFRKLLFCLDEDPSLIAAFQALPNNVISLCEAVLNGVADLPAKLLPHLAEESQSNNLMRSLIQYAVDEFIHSRVEYLRKLSESCRASVKGHIRVMNSEKATLVGNSRLDVYHDCWASTLEDLRKLPRTRFKDSRERAVKILHEGLSIPLLQHQKEAIKKSVKEKLIESLQMDMQTFVEDHLTKRISNFWSFLENCHTYSPDDFSAALSQLQSFPGIETQSQRQWMQPFVQSIGSQLFAAVPPSPPIVKSSEPQVAEDFIFLYRGLCSLASTTDDLPHGSFPYAGSLVETISKLLEFPVVYSMSAFACAEYVLRQVAREPVAASIVEIKIAELEGIALGIRKGMETSLCNDSLRYRFQQQYTNTDPGFMKWYKRFCDQQVSTANQTVGVDQEQDFIRQAWSWASAKEYLLPKDASACRLHGNPHVSLSKNIEHTLRYSLGLKSYIQGIAHADPKPVTVGEVLGVIAIFRIPRPEFEQAKLTYCNDLEDLLAQKKVGLSSRVISEQEVCFYGMIELKYFFKYVELKLVDIDNMQAVKAEYGIETKTDVLYPPLKRAVADYNRIKANKAAQEIDRNGANYALRTALQKIYMAKIIKIPGIPPQEEEKTRLRKRNR